MRKSEAQLLADENDLDAALLALPCGNDVACADAVLGSTAGTHGIVALTEQGSAIAAQGRELQQQYFAAMYQGISQEELQIWKKIVLKVQNNIRNFDNIL